MPSDEEIAMGIGGQDRTLVGSSLLAAESSVRLEIQRQDYIQIWDISARRLKQTTIQDLGVAIGVSFS